MLFWNCVHNYPHSSMFIAEKVKSKIQIKYGILQNNEKHCLFLFLAYIFLFAVCMLGVFANHTVLSIPYILGTLLLATNMIEY